ncbi:uncharacterized protein ACRADG_013108 [Cochliomyia hominivorax]
MQTSYSWLLASIAIFLIGLSESGAYRFPVLDDNENINRLEFPNARVETLAEILNYRLPNSSYPEHYDITLTTNVHTGARDFTGLVVIDIVIVEPTTEIVIHARQTGDYKVNISNPSTGLSEELMTSYETERDFLTLKRKTDVPFDADTKWKLTISYTGKLRTDNKGFYLSSYNDTEGNIHYLATTQFESTEARHAFPCYDEPGIRANFTITINHGPAYSAVSNMPVNEALSSSGKTVFLTTARIPAYIVAFIVSDFVYTEGGLDGLTYRLYSRPSGKNDHEFALVSAMLITERLSEYNDVPFMLPKLDQAAIPDFWAGGMENWGLATYREEYMLINRDKSTTFSHTSSASITAHEIGHQWFGDYVAVKWWTYLWLKEGFATLFSYQGMDDAYPEWGVWQSFHVNGFQSSLVKDGGKSPRPMTHYVQTPKEISSVYDYVTYDKASDVLFMFRNALTESVFKRGLHNYLTINQYSAAVEQQLFEAIQTAAKEENYPLPATISEMMGSWSRQGGYPLLNVTRNYNDGTFTVTQQAYHDDVTIKDDKTWYVPINFVVASNPDFRDTEATHYLLNVTEIKVADVKVDKNDWLILNKQSTGFYRINYDLENWNLIADGLNAKPYKIHPHNRAQLMHDAHYLSASGRLTHDILMKLMTYLKQEDQYAPWATASGIFNNYNRYLCGDEKYDDLKFFIAEQITPIFERLGVNDVPGEQHYVKSTRNIVINLACLADVKDCLVETNNKIKALAKHSTPIEPNVQSSVYCNGLKQSGDEEFNFIYNRLMDSTDASYRNLLISSLGCSQNENQIKKFIYSSIDKSNKLRPQERYALLKPAYSRGEVGLMSCIDFLNENWNEYANLKSGVGGSNPLDDDMRGMSTYVVNKKQQDKYLALLDKVKNSQYVTDTLEADVKSKLADNIEWLNKNRYPIMNWIAEYRAGGSGSGSGSGGNGTDVDGGGNGAGGGSASLTVSSVLLVSALIMVAMRLQCEYITDVYDTTPKMSAYILAFIVSEFNDRYDGEFGALARPEYYSQTEYAYDVGKKLLKALDDYMGIPYYTMGIDKMHVAAIPDFSAGAMENWGLLTYRERALLYDEEHSTLSSKQYIAAVITHEQAHMWYGDLVTCDWWSYTWLNEGFARYFQYFGTNMVESYFELDKQFPVDQIQSVMGMDATNGTNPMSDENTHSPADSSRMFNSISYNKGATFIRMTKHILSEETFQKAMNDYLKNNSYKNVVPEDLFSIWRKYWPGEYAQYADKYFKSFTTQVGYPVVTFNRVDDTTVEVSQKRFLLKDFETADPHLTYTVPITYTTSAEKDFKNLYPKLFLEETPKKIAVNKDATWIVGNIQETGYYRVNYDTKSWHRIHHKLYADNWDGIHELNRAQVVDDLLNLARAGEIDYSLAFDVLEYLETETNYLPWTSAFNGFSYVTIRLGTDTKDFAKYILYLTNKVYNKLGFEEKKEDTTLDIYNRGKVLSWICKYGHAECISKAKSYFNENLKSNPVPVNIRGAVYCTAMREGNEQDFNKLYNKFKTETVATEETLILNSLGCVKDSKLVERFYNMIVSDEVRRQDKSSALSSLYSENNENVERVFDLINKDVEALVKALGDYSSVASVVSNIAARFTTEDQYKKLKDFNSKHNDKFGSSASTLNSAEKTVEFNLNWSKEKMGPIRTFLQQHGKNSAGINSISIATLTFVALIAMILSTAALLGAFFCLSYATPLTDGNETPVPIVDVNYRLPLTIYPVNYKITLKPYLEESHPRAFSFDGECYLEIQPKNNTKQIQLHIKNLEISLSEYYQKDTPNNVKALPNVTPNTLTDIVVYDLEEELKANVSYILHYKYVGHMDDDMHGFYRSYYQTSKNVTKWLGATQFQRNHARRAFPSFDEPKFKATFDLSLTRHRSLKTTGPTRLIDIKPEGEYITDVYDTTPKMSAYILAFIVSEFNDRYDGEFGVLARPEYYSQTEYAYDVGKKLLKALDDFTGIPYYSMGVDKMHVAAIPDFSAGAMENWGLLTYRERALLFDDNHSTLSSKESIASIIAHEQAHMWFGDLVTCDWWSYTWLNEGFASYFEYFTTHTVDSSFEMDKQFVVDYVQSVMGMDATNATNPMSDEDTHTPSDLARMFNSISYNKAASFIRMTRYILGEESFKKAMNEYLTTNAYTNTVPEDLLKIWKKYWPIQYSSYADKYFYSFTTQVGYPVVTFNRTDDTTVQISQKRFLLKDFDTANPSLTYTVPITYTTSAEKNFVDATPKLFLQENPVSVTINKDATWIVGNIQETGYYRVNYDTKSWHRIHHKLYADNWDGIHELNRAQVVDDLLNLARAGEIDYSLAFDVLEYLETETNYLPWTSAFNGFNYITIRLGTDTKDFADYLHYLTNKVYNKLGFEEKKEDTPLDIYTRSRVLSWICKFGHAECISKAKSYFNKDLKANPVPVNIRSVVYCSSMREGNEQDFNKLYNKFKTETVATEETLLLTSLGCVKDSKLVERFFNMIMSDEVRRQDKSRALSSLYSENNENVDPVFDLVEKNVDALANAMGDYSSVASVVSNIASRFTTKEQLEKLKTFNNKYQSKFDSSTSTLKNAEKTVEFNLNWSNDKLGPIKTFLREHAKSGAAVNSISFVALVMVVLITKIFMSPISVAAILVAFLGLSYAAPLAEEIQKPAPTANVNYRLPLTIYPVNYKINLKPYLDENHSKAFTFDGECYIEIIPINNTKQIQLHIKNLEISLSQYYPKGTPNNAKDLPKVSPNTLTDIVVYDLNEELKANVSYILHYKYVGHMDDDMAGFYRSYYKTSKNVTKWLGSTQFQRSDARRAFPSFDEPKFKATFDLSLTRHRSLRTAANTRLIAIKPEGEYITDVYDTTPKMSAYILAFIVSEFNDRYDGEFGVLARPEYYSQTEYASDAGKKLLKALDEYTGIPYYTMGIDKMHVAAIPDFSAGAMENWGLLTYRERALLFDDDHSTLSSKQYISSIIAHEQAHMWYGDLVTCDWWSYTWLNEGFASYFQYFANYIVDSSFEMDKQFVVDYVQTVMGMDATNATNPMSDEDVHSPTDSGRMFNSISYNKAASFIRMTRYILGEESFKKAMNEYLKTNAFTNTVPEDLLKIWKKYWPTQYSSYADKYFYSFTTQVGYPVVTFNRTDDTTVQISQKRFLLKDFDTANPSLTYTVPITYTTSAEKNFVDATPKLFLQENPISVTVNKDVTWIVGNIQETGYYRVNYDTKSWHRIHHKLYADNWDGIHELNRAQVVDDLLNLARAGEIDYSLAFDVLEYLETETNYLPWTSAFNGFNYITIRLGTDTKDFADYLRHLTNKVYNKLGFEERKEDTPLDIYTRTKVLSWICKFGHAECISKAKSYFNKNLKSDPVPANIRSVVYCSAMREGNEQDFNKLYNKYKTETVATEETLILNSMGCVKDEKLVERYFNMVVSDDVRRQDKTSALSSLYSENNENVEPVFDLVDKNIDKLADSLGGYSSVASVVSNIASRFTTKNQLDKLKSFNSRHSNKLGASVSTLERAVKTVEFNLNWSDKKLGTIKTFLREHAKSSATINGVSIVSLVLVTLLAKIIH